jgi:hypothetical protein
MIMKVYEVCKVAKRESENTYVPSCFCASTSLYPDDENIDSISIFGEHGRAQSV